MKIPSSNELPREKADASRGVRDEPTRARRRAPRRATADDAFALARRKWLAGQRIDMGSLASELGVGRATLFRWVGSRELLYGEILSAEYARVRAQAVRAGEGSGADLVADVVRRGLRRLLSAAPLRRFIESDPEFAIRVLTSKSSPVQARCIELECELLRELECKGQIQPALDVEALGFLIVRIAESFLYGDVISGREPDVTKAVDAIRILVAAEAGPHRTRR